MTALTFDRLMFERVKTKKQWASWVKRLKAAKSICFDTETTGLDTFTVNLVGTAWAIQEGDRIEACYVPLSHQEYVGTTLTIRDVLDDTRDILQSGKPIVGANLLYDMLVMRQPRYNVSIANVHDTQLMSYALTGNLHMYHGMDALAERVLNYKTIKFADIVNEKIGVPDFSYVDLKTATLYSAEDAAVTLLIAKVLQQQLQKAKLWNLYDKIDRPLLPVLCDMKLAGIKVDYHRLEYLSAEFKAAMLVLERTAYKQAGGKYINMRSSPQIAALLYDEMKIGPPGYTDKGAPSADKDTLEQIHGVPVVDTILAYKQYATLVSTFCDGLPEKKNKRTGRVHTDLKITSTKTRRFSSAGPNLQNIPTRTEMGQQIREAFVADKGNVLISADYSQIEYRVLAHVTGDPYLLRAFNDKIDMHALMAADVFGGNWRDYNNKADKRRYSIRGAMKNVNFATIYGAGGPKVARMSGIEVAEAFRLLDAHHEMCPGVYDWKEQTWNFAKQFGYVENLFGGRCHVTYINSKNMELRGHAERLAINAPIQGGAAELIRKAMPSVNRVEGARLLLQVHDELVLECATARAEAIAPIVKAAMETCADDMIEWRVPIVAETGIGKNWREAK